jgi:polysaccharide deacetylase family protein (PEP-CTERM system associated)
MIASLQPGLASSPAHRAPSVPLNALTIDLSGRYEWRVEGATQYLLDILANAGVQGTFFVLDQMVERLPFLVRAIQEAGHEVGCTSRGPLYLSGRQAHLFRAELRQARATLEDILGESVHAYRAQGVSITRQTAWALDVLIEEGFLFDSSVYPVLWDRQNLEPYLIHRPAGNLWEFPLPAWTVLGCALPVGGGRSFDLYPYVLTRRVLRAINASGQPFAFYWHADRQNVTLRRTEKRLLRLLRDFPFAALSQCLAHWRPSHWDVPQRQAA